MPTDCEPWPGKTKATDDIGPERTAVVAGDPIACMLARMTDIRVRATTRPAPRREIAQRFEADLSAPVLAAGTRLPNVRQISERVAMGRASGASS